MSNNPLKIRQVHHIEFYVGNAKQADYFYRNAFGFDRVAYTGLETGNREQCSYALQQGAFKLLLTTPYTSRDASSVHIMKHGDGVRDIAFEVDDADYAFEEALARGAEPAVALYAIESGGLVPPRAGAGAVHDVRRQGYFDRVHGAQQHRHGERVEKHQVPDRRACAWQTQEPGRGVQLQSLVRGHRARAG